MSHECPRAARAHVTVRLAAVAALAAAACTPDEAPLLGKEAMLDPETCASCHEAHYTEWSGSMHAYAAEDPVFLAMNRRGQRETDGALGAFCVNCHAPMAVRLGLTKDGLDLDAVPAYAKGVTCYFCHSATEVTGTHNAPIELAGDLVMRGAIQDPVANTAHASLSSPLLDRSERRSADLCGSCHDIVTPPPHEVHLERTFAEWKASLFSKTESGDDQTCGSCHMKARDDVAANFEGVFLRPVHDHKMVGADVALTEFPDRDAQLEQIQRELDTTLLPRICVVEAGGATTITLRLENQAAGHSWPSGAAQDRRAWVEVVAYDAADAVVFSSGVVPDTEPLASIKDPNLWRFGDTGFDAQGNEAHMFWEIAKVESALLEAPVVADKEDPAWKDIHRTREYLYSGPLPSRVTMRVRLRPIGLDVLDSLIASGDLEPEHRAKMPTFTLGSTNLEWKLSLGVSCYPKDHE